MARVSEMFPSKYLKASDLAEFKRNGRLPLKVRIVRVAQEQIGMDEESKRFRPVCYFHNGTKGMVLNRTNAALLTDVAGSDDTDHWIDLVVGLDVQKDRYKNDVVDCLRFVALRNQSQPAAAPSAPTRRAVDDQATRVARVATPAPAVAERPPFDDTDDSVPAFGHDRDDDIPF